MHFPGKPYLSSTGQVCLIVSVLATSAVDMLGSSSDHVKPKTMKSVFVASPLST